MKTFLKWFLSAIVVLFAVFVIGGFFIPSKWSVSKDIIISAPEEKVFEQIANLKNWEHWSPWNKEMDPTQTYSFEGPEKGVGAKWLWQSQKGANGWLEIKTADEKKGISYEVFLDLKGSKYTMFGDISYVQTEHGLHVTWKDSNDAKDNLFRRWQSLIFKPMIAKDFEKGLNKLKSVVEAK